MATDDMELMRQYAVDQSESAFTELVSRHANLVYSTALRQVRDPQLAEEIAQGVFIILARKAGSLSGRTVLTGWLYRTACYVSNAARRKEFLRRMHEQEAHMQPILQTDPPNSVWEQLFPLLEEAMLRLGQIERDAILLRFFEGRSFSEVGIALGTSEDAAKKRVSRALEKLHRYFSRRGVSLTTAIIAAAISAHSVQAAPVALTKTVTAVAVGKGVTATGSTLGLTHAALKIMAWAKLKIATEVGVAVLVTAGIATGIVLYKEHVVEDEVWTAIAHVVKDATQTPGSLPPSDLQQVQSMPEAVSIRPTQFASLIDDGLFQHFGGNMLVGVSMPASGLVGHAYAINRTRIVNPEMLPPGKYDFVVNMPDHPMEAFQAEIKKQFGLVAAHEMRDTNVLVLTVANADAPRLRPNSTPVSERGSKADWFFGTGTRTNERIQYRNRDMDTIALLLEHQFGIPVINQTQVPGLHDIEMELNNADQKPDLQSVNQSLLEQLGLQLTPATQTIDMVVLKKKE